MVSINGLFKISIFAVWFCLLTLPAGTVPKYADKKNALTLALAVEKGEFDGSVILAAYAMNREDNYYVAVTLSNGRTERWFLDDIYKFSRDGRLNLKGNKALIFPDSESSEFEILDKNAFHRMALKAKAIRVVYDDIADPLASQSLVHKIKEFFLIPPEDKSFGKDRYGYPYRYKVDLYSCDSVLLSYREVLESIKAQHFLSDAVSSGLQPLDRPYKITSVVGYEKALNRVYSQFGLEITFDRKIELSPENFPVLIREQGSGLKNGEKKKDFIVEVVLPNTVTNKVVRMNLPNSNNQLEYLSDIKVVQNGRNRCQSVLIADFNHEIMDIPPYITKIAEDKIFVTFFNIVDQTISAPPVTKEEADSIISDSQRWLNVSPTIQLNSDFGRHYNQALEYVNKAYEEEVYDAALALYLQGIDSLEKAALLARDDNSLIEVLNQRNTIRKRVTFVSVEKAISEIRKDQPDKALITKLLQTAGDFADSEQQNIEIEKLRRRAGI